MPIATDYSDFSRSRPREHFSADSGDLGPPDRAFLPDAAEEAPFAQSVTLDAARERLNEEIRRLAHTVRELTSNLEESTGALAEQQQRRVKATEGLRAIEHEPGKHGRGAIARAYQEWAQAETAANGLREVCDQLRTAIESDGRCLEALELALQAMADATFLSEHQTPLGDVSRPFRGISRSLAHDGHMADFTPLRSEALPPAQPPKSVTVAQLVNQESMLVAREYDRRALAHSVDTHVRQALSDAILQAELCEAAMRSDPTSALTVTGELKGRLNDALRETDILIFELEPMMLSELGLAGTLQRYVQDLITSRGAPIGVRVGTRRRYHIAIERAVFRVAREALANAMRHAHARHIQVALSHTADALILSVEDDGVGFEVVPVMERARRGFHSGLGQLCIEADLVGGLLGVKSSEGNGTRIDYIVAESAALDAAR
ncbi:MAG: hypothetical protein H0X24_02815 [Ktedonobacterales bacterium]|nr:hypothetical protein [Ktedonobacterales bacterium]